MAIAREIASACAHLFGRAHRAVLTDWDNTLWRGEVGELGPLGIVCGQDTPDGLAYYMLQAQLRGLSEAGVLLAAVSRNDPNAARVLDENPDLALRRDNFGALALDWGDKSVAVGRISADFGFGADLMLYLDDNPVDLAEVASAYPFIDIVLAGPSADLTLDRLTGLCNFTHLTEDDANRTSRIAPLVAQAQALRTGGDTSSFLASLQMRLRVHDLTQDNLGRVTQLLHKTNQFNLTTKRYSEADVRRLAGSGAQIGVFSYEDRSGPQGIISVVILMDDAAGLTVDTWLMSCRVLNRGVETAVFQWIAQQGNGRDLIGRFEPTDKNGLVSKLYDGLGFEAQQDAGGVLYRLKANAALGSPTHHLEIIDERHARAAS
jgi:FkbH-like protein